MFLESLSIHNEDVLIRHISFHKGINLIIDETKKINKTDSGNSVGKTTVLRLIDFCLDGKGDNIYTDPEFKDSNSTIKKFLTENNIIIKLVLIENIDDKLSSRITIERNFLTYKDKIQNINGEKFKNKEFSNELKRLLFNTTIPKPTFKQLKSKNIRDEKNKLVNTIKVLPANIITDVAYEALHLFWFGIGIDSSKDKLVTDRNLEIKLQRRLRQDSDLSQINQSLIIINKEIEELKEKKEKFSLNEKYETELEALNKTKIEINQLSTSLSRLEIRKELILESKEDLEKDTANIDIEQIKRLYKKAQYFIPNIQKTFEETLSFHNGMIQQKITFITEELPNVETKIQEAKKELNTLFIKEKQLTKSLKKSGIMENFQTIVDSLNSFHEKKGHFEEQKNIWEKSNKKLEGINKQLEEINEGIFAKDAIIQKRIEDFNVFFSDISSRLDGVYSLLSADNSDGVYKFKIGNIEGNPGTGSKKSQMASFDLAYIKFADTHEIPCLHFVLQDQIENVHSNQITNLLTEIVEEVNCQYILPVLRDKLPNNIDISQFEVLSLSQKDKLFKI